MFLLNLVVLVTIWAECLSWKFLNNGKETALIIGLASIIELGWIIRNFYKYDDFMLLGFIVLIIVTYNSLARFISLKNTLSSNSE